MNPSINQTKQNKNLYFEGNCAYLSEVIVGLQISFRTLAEDQLQGRRQSKKYSDHDGALLHRGNDWISHSKLFLSALSNNLVLQPRSQKKKKMGLRCGSVYVPYYTVMDFSFSVQQKKSARTDLINCSDKKMPEVALIVLKTTVHLQPGLPTPRNKKKLPHLPSKNAPDAYFT